MDTCLNDEHNLDEYFNVGGGAVMVGCTKCAYWEPAVNGPIEVTLTDADGNQTIHHPDGTVEYRPVGLAV